MRGPQAPKPFSEARAGGPPPPPPSPPGRGGGWGGGVQVQSIMFDS